MSSSDEGDYMSDKFSCEKIADVRPGLVFGQKRKHEIAVNSKRTKIDQDHQSQRPVSHKQRQQDQLEKGLASAIPKTNIGFSLLAKMGYQEGTSLGKGGQSGLMVPIGITVKADRQGLGREVAVKQLRQRQQELARAKTLQRARAEEYDPNEFRQRMIRNSKVKQVEGDFLRCQRACQRLDLEMQFEEPTVEWFWPEKTKVPAEVEEDDDCDDRKPDGDEQSEEVQYEPHEKLELVNDYLRSTHCFCNWCGVKYESFEDMTTNCPGTTRNDH